MSMHWTQFYLFSNIYFVSSFFGSYFFFFSFFVSRIHFVDVVGVFVYCIASSLNAANDTQFSSVQLSTQLSFKSVQLKIKNEQTKKTKTKQYIKRNKRNDVKIGLMRFVQWNVLQYIQFFVDVSVFCSVFFLHVVSFLFLFIFCVASFYFIFISITYNSFLLLFVC